jgi:peptide/nickel transport system substrate-binding protein
VKVARFAISDETKQRAKRALRRRRRSAQDLGQQADEQIERLLIRRFDRLVSVRRFVLLWVSLFVLLFFFGVIQQRSLGRYYQASQPVPGGVFSEGMVGTFTNANPIYATGTANYAISRLIFSGLFKYDRTNTLVGDLARTVRPDKSEKNYIVSLRTNIFWHDGQPFTADDVVFTYNTIQNPVAQSPLYTSWQGIEVSKIDDYTLNFKLPNTLSAFPYSLTNGILPAHLLKNIAPEQLRSAPFNTRPVGTGAFAWKFVEVSSSTTSDRHQRVTLEPNDRYWLGKPKLDGFSVSAYSDETQLIKAFEDKQVNSMSGLDSVPEDLATDSTVETYETPLTSAVMTFFNNSRPILNEVNVRRALVSAIDIKEVGGLVSDSAGLIKSPLLDTHIGFDPTILQLPYNQAYANQLLDQAGYIRGADGIRAKAGQPMQFILNSQNNQQYTAVAKYLQKKWAEVGVKVMVRYYKSGDLQSDVISTHDYDMLLYGISLGADPDVYAYWDSSQASISSQGHLNLSEYKSSVVDQALESGRTRADPLIRAVKYRSFQSTWVQDAPALSLYQPTYLYISRGPIFGYQRTAMLRPADRFYNVDNWMIRQERKTL